MARIRPTTPPARRRRAALAAALLATLPATAQEAAPAPVQDPAYLDAERMPRVGRSLLLDAHGAEGVVVAVGERGHVLRSTDGTTWTQAERVPTRSTLTSVTAAGGQWWAAGHDGVILHSADGGRTWTAQRVAPWSPDQADPAEGIPLLDLHFDDAQRGVAVGAYSLRLVTGDGGATWIEAPAAIREDIAPPVAADPAADPVVDADGVDDSWLLDGDDLLLEDDADPHLNAVVRTGDGALVMVGERGSVLRSRDDGASWERLALPYGGSMFGVLAWEGDHILAFGMRGRAFESHDLGDTWREVATGAGASLMGGAALPGGGAVLVGAQGTVAVRAAADAPFRVHTFVTDAGETPTLAAVLPAAEGALLLFGEHGAAAFVPAAAR
ncbi:WD40/YVTN/BNR-like repeat-containing protein [Coralloluteibacterium thermophilus]|uniref:WD40/YVTN/BNR-like repeat-containing protein n=1 Tax=Coralloluteibacterium thermophilum TaxID=2707049 RepID=A0ABV9NI89_9GAMM